jgi:hypothetical protein
MVNHVKLTNSVKAFVVIKIFANQMLYVTIMLSLMKTIAILTLNAKVNVVTMIINVILIFALLTLKLPILLL